MPNLKHLFYLRNLIHLRNFLLLNLLALFLPYNAIFGAGFSVAERLGIFIFSFSIFAQSIIFPPRQFFKKQSIIIFT